MGTSTTYLVKAKTGKSRAPSVPTSQLNIYGTLTYCLFASTWIKHLYHGKQITELCNKAEAATVMACSLWGHMIRGNMDPHDERLKVFGDSVRGAVPPYQFTRTALDMLRSVEDALLSAKKPNRAKIAAVSELSRLIYLIHRYVDRRGDREEAYQRAEAVVEKWREAIGGE